MIKGKRVVKELMGGRECRKCGSPVITVGENKYYCEKCKQEWVITHA